MSLVVTWVGGSWFVDGPNGREQLLGGGRWLDEWLAAHGASRRDLEISGGRALRERFVNDFGPLG